MTKLITRTINATRCGTMEIRFDENGVPNLVKGKSITLDGKYDDIKKVQIAIAKATKHSEIQIVSDGTFEVIGETLAITVDDFLKIAKPVSYYKNTGEVETISAD